MTAVPSHAQQITTAITGQVTNQSGAALGNALVLIVDTRTGATTEIRTDSKGLFTASGLPTGGPYTVTATAANYQGQTVEGIQTTLQGATQLTFSLSPVAAETTAETIVITAARAKVTQLEIGPGTSFSTQVMETAPSYNRDVRDVIRIDPRVSLDREDTATGGSGVDRISCLGGNDRGNSFTVDGIPQGDIYGLNDTGFSSRSSTPVPYDAVRETQVQFAPYDVEYGNFTGCAINVVTKSGTNRLHGSAFYEFGDKDWRGDKLPGRTVGGVDDDKNWGVSVGGPIIKDRLFVFGAYENRKGGLAQDEGPTGGDFANPIPGISVDQFNAIADLLRTTYGIDPGPLVHVRPFENKRLFGRVDWQINDDHRLETTYQRLRESTIRSDDFFTGSSPQVTGLNSFYVSGTKSSYYSARLYSNWNDRLSTELRGSYSDIQDVQDPVGGGEAQSENPIPRILVGVDNPPLGSSPSSQAIPDGVVQAGPGANRSANDLKSKLYQVRAVANYDAGAHRIKLGFDANHAKLNNLFINNATGTLVFRNIADLQAGLLSPGTGNNNTSTFPDNIIPGSTEGAFINATPTGNPLTAAARFKRTIVSPFVQDDWRINDRLSAVLGVRVDIFSGGRPAFNPNYFRRYGITNNTGFNDLDPIVLPRIALTYDASDFLVFSNTQLRAGVGLFSGGDPLVWFANGFQNNGQILALGTSQAAGCPAGQIDVVDAGGNFTGFPQCVVNAASATAAAGQGFVQAVDPNIKLPTVIRANLGVQTAINFAPTGFFSDWRMNVDFIYSRFRNPFTMVDLSQVPDPRLGLNGFTIDGRPIYRTIDPLLCGAKLVDIAPTPIYEGVTNACFTSAREDELLLTNAGGYTTKVASIFLSKNFRGGVFTSGGRSYFSVGYAFTDAHDRRNMYNSTAGSNYDQTAAFDRQDPAVSRGFFASRHNFTVSGSWAEQFIPKHDTRLSFTFVARAGRPYSLTFGSSGRFNDSASGSNNALLYVPTGIDDPNISPSSTISAGQLQSLVDFLHGLPCARKYAGRTIARNSCTNDWYYDMDVSFSQEFPGPGRWLGRKDDVIKVFATVDNFLNLLKSSWNIQRRRQFAGLQDVAGLSCPSNPAQGPCAVDAQGRYIFSSFNGVADFENDNFINVSSSVWRLKVGVSYDF
jgi:outer membrane receptor for ferrienterochelin and colicin